jgi:hypothetical protein
VVAVDTEPGEGEPGERRDPRRLEVAEAHDGVDGVALGEGGDVVGRRFVGQGEQAHGL